MASGPAPRWRLFLHRHARWLFVECAGGNMHWRWDRWCWCTVGENGQTEPVRLGVGADEPAKAEGGARPEVTP